MSTYKSYNFTFTNWNLNSDKVFIAHDDIIKYIAYGLETCPNTGRLHHQGFLSFYNQRSASRKSLGVIGNLFKLNNDDLHAHIEPMRGSLKSNENYCSKESELNKHGDEPSQGARKDLMKIKDTLLKGQTSVDKIASEDPLLYHQYGRTLEKIEAIALRKKWRNWMTQGLWYYGPTGVGKSHKAYENYHPDTHYIKDLNVKWWDGYTGQPIVIFNEFRGQITFSELLDICDKWPKTVPIRNKESVPLLAKTLIVTSCHHPRLIYNKLDEDFAQLERRFVVEEMAWKCSEGNNETSEPEI